MINATDQKPSVRVAFRAWTLAWLIALMCYSAPSIRASAWLTVSPEVTKIMTREQTDHTTLDLFVHECQPGRPKTSSLSRDEQLCINKRSQLKRDKVRGLKRVELKPNAEAVEALNELAESRNMSHSELIKEILM